MLYLNAYDISRKRLWAVQLSWWHQMHVHFISGDITKKYLWWVVEWLREKNIAVMGTAVSFNFFPILFIQVAALIVLVIGAFY